jgi:hypothetical protein
VSTSPIGPEQPGIVSLLTSAPPADAQRLRIDQRLARPSARRWNKLVSGVAQVGLTCSTRVSRSTSSRITLATGDREQLGLCPGLRPQAHRDDQEARAIPRDRGADLTPPHQPVSTRTLLLELVTHRSPAVAVRSSCLRLLPVSHSFFAQNMPSGNGELQKNQKECISTPHRYRRRWERASQRADRG